MEGIVHIDKALSNVSVAYKNKQFVAEQVYLPVPVEFKSDKYYIQGMERFRSRNDRRSPGAEATKSRALVLSNDTYFCEGHALKDYVSREDQGNQDPALDLMVDTTEILTEQVALNQEVGLVAKLAADLTGAQTVSLTSIKWDTVSSGVSTNNPIAKIRAYMDSMAKATGVVPNKLVLSKPVWTAVRQNTFVTGLVTGAPNLVAGKVTAQQFAELCDLDEVIIAEAVYDTAKEGQTASLDFVWGKTALLFYRPPAPGRKVLALGYHFYWKNALGSMAGMQAAQGVNGIGAKFVQQYYWQPNLADVVEVHSYYDQKTVATGCGTLFTACIV